eukprot:11640494-Alexandrium_andersonii.AAC.1
MSTAPTNHCRAWWVVVQFPAMPRSASLASACCVGNAFSWKQRTPTHAITMRVHGVVLCRAGVKKSCALVEP